MTHPMPPARAARRQLFQDRTAEYLTERGADPDHAAGYARAILGIADQLGFTLPAAIDDPPPLRGTDAKPSGPGWQAFQAARTSLASRRRDTP